MVEVVDRAAEQILRSVAHQLRYSATHTFFKFDMNISQRRTTPFLPLHAIILARARALPRELPHFKRLHGRFGNQTERWTLFQKQESFTVSALLLTRRSFWEQLISFRHSHHEFPL